MGPPSPHPQASVSPPFGSGGGGSHSLAGVGVGVPIRTWRQTLWYSRLKMFFCGTKCLIGFYVRVFESVAKCKQCALYVIVRPPPPPLPSALTYYMQREDRLRDRGARSKIERRASVRLPAVSNDSRTVAHKCGRCRKTSNAKAQP